MLRTQVPSYFKERRAKLAAKHPGAVFLLPAAEEVLRNPDVHYPFRQESNFYYLTGFEEPESFLVLAPQPSRPGSHRTILFVRKRDAEREMWEGERHGIDGALKVFGADEAYLIEELSTRLPALLQGCDQVFYRMGLHESTDRVVLSALEKHRLSLGRSGKSLPPLNDPNLALGEMRLFKSAEEVDLLRKASQITALAHQTAMKEIRPGMNEGEIEALVDYVFRKNGCQRVGYGSIVAGGKNAACLHYRANNETLKDGDLILIDAGGEYDYFTADITRVFPVGRGFSATQAKLYDLVLKIQKDAIAQTRPGVTLPELHKGVCEALIDGCLSLGLLKGAAAEIYRSGAFKRFYPHNTSHWLGMDVHDVGLYQIDGSPRKLEAGMCLTIEPGFYIQPGDRDLPKGYESIGIRIEDDILVTAGGCEVLTRDAPKERADIERLK